MASKSPNDIQITEARAADIESLQTILARSFHPVNPYIEEALPNLPTVRQWWAQVFEDEINDPACHLLVALDPSTESVVGVLALRFFNPDERGVGFWSSHELAEECNSEMVQAMTDSMIEHRERIMLGRRHFLVQLFGTDHRWKGQGVGGKLLQRACEIAKEEGVDVFVQANGSAKGFYERYGFVTEGEAVMPGEAKYAEYMLVWQYRSDT